MHKKNIKIGEKKHKNNIPRYLWSDTSLLRNVSTYNIAMSRNNLPIYPAAILFFILDNTVIELTQRFCSLKNIQCILVLST